MALLSVILVIAIALLLYWGVAFYRQRRQLFPAHRVSRSSAADSEFEQVWLAHSWGKTEAHLKLAGNQNDGRALPAAIVVHGQLGIIDTWHERMSGLLKRGVHYLLVEYPGYGDSEGECSESTLTDVVTAAYDYLAAHPAVDSSAIIGVGRSMGGGVITTLLGQREFSTLILMSTFTSVKPFFRRKAIPGWLVRDPLDSLARLKQTSVPTLVYHGYQDDVIPVSHARALASAGDHCQLVLEQGDHDSAPASWDEFWQLAVEFHRKSVAD